ncbi:ubiquitin family protein [Salix suchowensis]|nr:ubiquitin family protein [Salix suchowensis]
MRVAVEILTGTLFYIQVGNDATVADLKKEIEAQQKLPRDRLILLLISNKRRHLINEEGDGATLVDCGVQDGSHIYLFFGPVDHHDESTDHLVFTWPHSFLEQA